MMARKKNPENFLKDLIKEYGEEYVQAVARAALPEPSVEPVAETKNLADVPVAVRGEFSWALQRLQEGKQLWRPALRTCAIVFDKNTFRKINRADGTLVDANWTPSLDDMLALNWNLV